MSDARSLRATSFAMALDELGADPLARREFLTRMGAAIAFAGAGACTRAPREEIIPYVVPPPEAKPGIPRYYATATTLDGYATGILVESHTGRPTKVEGNPEHPASLGAAGVFEQASLLALYDPSRAHGVRTRGSNGSWPQLTHDLADGSWSKDGGRGLHLHLERTSSPTALGLIEAIRARHPRATISFASAANVNAWEGARMAFGRVLEPRYALATADVIVALDADLLGSGPASLRHARQFAERRVSSRMNRLYVVEPLVTVTGGIADHRLRVRASEVLAIAAALAAAVKLPELPGGVPPELAVAADPHRPWVEAVARDLVAHRGRSLVVVGDAQPPEVHALAHVMNAALGNFGVTVTLAASPIAAAGEDAPHSLADALTSGDVDTLVVCAANPVYSSPKGAQLGALFARARQSIYLGLHEDETAAVSTVTVARAHALESWGDARAFDGTLSVIQPLIEPLFGGRTELEVLAIFAGSTGSRPHDLVRSRIRNDIGQDERAWRSALKRGIVDGSEFPPTPARVDWGRLGEALAGAARSPREVGAANIELVRRLDPNVHDGRFANNAWLLELPSPITKLTWTNAATLSVDTAAKLGIATGDELVLQARDGARVKAPACVVPGQADGTVGLSLGWGRTRGADLAQGRGTNALLLGSSASVTLAKTAAKHELPITQTQRRLLGRDEEILRHAKVQEHRSRTEPPAARGKRKLSLYDREPGPSDRQWGMAIDLSRCTGCSACVVACQAENNIPTVGPDNVVLNREMHWLRIDSYFVGDQIASQPMLCQHCESAPCEYVCPVNATVHSPDGLNEMVYNRCVGTRFCSNNCPYKVRRFNWFDFHRSETATQELVHNPDVTVRARGVMEKCTFCVQRLREWEIQAEQGRPPPPPRTACQQTCPTQAIVFGDLRAADSAVKRLHEHERAYGALEDLGTAPRVRYLSRLTNPNPELA